MEVIAQETIVILRGELTSPDTPTRIESILGKSTILNWKSMPDGETLMAYSPEIKKALSSPINEPDKSPLHRDPKFHVDFSNNSVSVASASGLRLRARAIVMASERSAHSEDDIENLAEHQKINILTKWPIAVVGSDIVAMSTAKKIMESGLDVVVLACSRFFKEKALSEYLRPQRDSKILTDILVSKISYESNPSEAITIRIEHLYGKTSEDIYVSGVIYT